jgi:flagellar biosynthesis protein FlhG
MGKIVSVLSGKGGVGKTFFSVSLGHALAEQQQRVLLFDGDLGLANVDIQIGMTAQRHVNDFLLGGAGFQDIVTWSPEIGCDVVSGRPVNSFLNSMTPAERRRIKEALVAARDLYGFVLVDLSAGIEEQVIDFLDICDHIFLVLRPEPTSIMDAYSVVKVLPAEARERILLVPNMVQTAEESESLIRAFVAVVSRFLKAEPRSIGFIRTDHNVPAAIRRQEPFMTRFPASSAAYDIKLVASRLLRVA